MSIQIEIEAVHALAEWKAQFAEEVRTHARRLAAEAGRPELVTLQDFRQSARAAMASLLGSIVEDVDVRAA